MRKFFIKMVFPLAFIGFGITGCNTNDEDHSPDVDPQAGKLGYLSLTLNHTDTKTKATDDDPGVNSEYSVESVRVVLYKAKDGIAAYSFDILASNNGGDSLFDGDDVATVTSPGNLRFTTKAKELEVDDYYLLALINYPPEVDAITKEGHHFDEFANSVYNLGTDYSKLTGVANPRYKSGSTANYKFFMSNFKKDHLIEGKRVMYDTAAEAERDPVNVIVDRAVAKVKLKQDALQTQNGTVENIVWKLDITNKQTFWVRHAAKMLDGQWEVRNEMDRTVLYAEDPNFDHISKLRNSSVATDPQAYFNYITRADLTDDGAEWEYVSENTMDAEDQWQDVITRMVIRLNFIPTGFGAGESYYWWRGHALTIQQMKGFADDIESVPEVLNGLQQTILKMIAGGYNFDNPGTINLPDIDFYKEGISYFATPIRHFNDEQAPANMQYGRYGVVRNNQYTLNLKKITGPGKPDIPGPEGPGDEDEKYLSVDIEIQNWFARDIQDIEN